MPNFALLTLSHHLFACNELPAIPTPCLVWFAITEDLRQMLKEIHMSCVFGHKIQFMCFVTTTIKADTLNVNKKCHVVIVTDQPG